MREKNRISCKGHEIVLFKGIQVQDTTVPSCFAVGKPDVKRSWGTWPNSQGWKEPGFLPYRALSLLQEVAIPSYRVSQALLTVVVLAASHGRRERQKLFWHLSLFDLMTQPFACRVSPRRHSQSQSAKHRSALPRTEVPAPGQSIPCLAKMQHSESKAGTAQVFMSVHGPLQYGPHPTG